MSVIVGMDMPKSCYACKLRKGCNCIIKKMYLPDLSVQNQDCPLKSIDGLIDKIIERGDLYTIGGRAGGKSVKFGMQIAIKIIKEYCEVKE